jgi:hypothetical protein
MAEAKLRDNRRATREGAFRLLFREFFSQLFLGEWSASDHQLRKAMIGIFVFVITPGLFIPFQLGGLLEFTALHDPATLDAITHLLATIFLAYSIVTIGVVAAFEWDVLGFDRRDAMVLGPLPVAGPLVVAAKTSALAALLLIAAGAINGLTAVTFSLVAAPNHSAWAATRMFTAHVIATMAASTFVFTALVTVRCAITLLGRGSVVVGSLLQFAVISALLCFLVFAPAAVRIEFPRRGALVQAVTVHLQPVPAWSPTNWFAALYDELRGGASAVEGRQALVAVALTVGSTLAAIAATAAGYRHQLRLALTPSSSIRVVSGARLPRAVARLFAGSDRSAQALSGFLITTLVRNRTQQASVAMNAAIAVVIAALDLSIHRADLTSRLSVFSPLPWLLVFWLAVGLRASFFVPSELPAAWIFRIGDRDGVRFRHAAVRGALAGMLVPVAIVCAGAFSIAAGWVALTRHLTVAVLATILLVELVACTVPFTPYSRPYQPGHAQLKTRWPLYAMASYVFAYRLPAVERACWTQPARFAALVFGLAILTIAIDLTARRRSASAVVQPIDEIAFDDTEITLLGIGAGEQRPAL